MTNPDNFAGLDRGGFLSHIGNCNAFDDSADGYCRADGVGTVILKRLEDAIADSDPIQAVIIGAYTNHSAEADSITRPHAGAQVAIFDKVLNESHVDPNDISYVEMHGTGTQIGDGLEMKSVLSVFAPHAGKRTNPLHLGSAKANVGHAESASGVTSLIKVLMMMEKNLIPPHCGIKTKINHTFPTDLSQRNVFIASKPVPWVRPEGGLRRVFLNNFSAAGGNTALLLEDAPNRTADGHEPRTWHLVAVSAKSASALTSNIHALLKYMDMNPNVSLPSLSYTTTARRLHYSYRSIIAGSDIQSISHGLASYVTGNVVSPTSSSSPSVAFSFTGQGSQYLGMGKQLFRNFSQFNRDMRRFDRIAQNQGFPSFIHLVDGSDEVSDISQVDPRALQVGTTCLQMALARLWASWGVVPTVVIGHSLGEYAALHAAGVISASDAIYLTGIRAQLLVKHCQAGTHTMLAVKASVSALQTHIQSTDVEIACVNSPTETVFSGTNSSIDHLSEKLNAINVKCTKLKIQFAFHSSQVDPILKEFQALAWGVTFHKPSIPVISPLTGELVTDCDVFGPAYLARHCRERVDFLSGIEAASHNKLVNSNTLWVEIGSHPVCSALVKAIIGPDVIALPSLRRNEDAWKTISETLSKLYLAGVPLKWDEYHRDFKNVEVLRLPSYCWDNKNHWIQYVHDWCLTKGDAPVSIPITKPLEAPASKLSTTTVQKIVEEVVKDGKLTITIESDIQRPDLHDVLKSHKVNGIALCPSSAYADIALTIADYLLSQSRPEIKGIAMDVCNMVVEKPLIARDLPSQLLRVTAAIEWTSKSTSLHFYSVDAEGRKTIDHARCTVQYADPTIWLSEWKRNAYFVHSRLEQLHKGVDEGDNHKMKRGIAYKLFDAVAEYGETYQGMKEVVINSAQLESTASVKFKAGEKDGTFYFSPYWIDSLGQLSGFTMNANEAVDTKAQVFINHGWDSMRCSKRLSQSALYTTYVRMQLVQGTLYAGDVYILEEDTIVAVYGGVKVDFSFTACFLLANADVAQFLGIPRKVLDSVLPPAGKASSQSKVVLKPAAPSALPASDGQIPIPSLSRSAPKRSATPTTVSRILAMVAEELGVQISELNDDVKFLDFGLDSLLSLTIIGKLREDLDLEVESTLFFDLPTVKDLKNFFSNREPSGQSTPDSYGETYSETNSSGLSTSNTFSESSVEMEFDVMDTIRHTLAEEIGVPLAELEDNVDLAELGLDSLMSLKVLSDLRENHDIDLDTEFFLKNCTLGAIQAHVGVKSPTLAVVPSAGKPTAPMIQQRTAKKPKATSVLLQGNLSMATKILWLFPDGSGSSTSYMAIPKIASDIAVFGLNCPYMKNAQGLMCGIDGLTVLYLKEIRRRQPHGPYFFGGWSAGGICAYDAAQVLQRSGETIARLILIDSPHPIGLEKLPPRLYEFFDSIKLFGEKPPPDWLFPHFLAFIDALDIYKAQPFASGKGPTTHVIWARDGVCKHPTDPRPDPRDDDPKEMKWLLNNRTDFGPNRWDQLVGKDSLVIETMDDANHFTMMEGQKAGELSAFLGRAMA
jgi:naphtho-gamma-pyrone polyketide synthase